MHAVQSGWQGGGTCYIQRYGNHLQDDDIIEALVQDGAWEVMSELGTPPGPIPTQVEAIDPDQATPPALHVDEGVGVHAIGQLGVCFQVQMPPAPSQ